MQTLILWIDIAELCCPWHVAMFNDICEWIAEIEYRDVVRRLNR